MVKFQVMSDLHIEGLFDPLNIEDFITPTAEVLILAGDIGRIHKFDQLKNFLTNLCKRFEYVLYTLGNHEYYMVENIPPKSMSELLTDIELIKKDIPNLFILNRSSVLIGDVCIAGCTLWSRTSIEIPPFIVRIHGMNSVKYNTLFREDLHYIESMIKYCQEKKLKLVMVTHHCPTYLVGRKKRDRYKSLYCSNLDNLLEGDKVHTWICGHVHANFDFVTKNGTRILSNQKGRNKDQIIDFSKEKIICI